MVWAMTDWRLEALLSGGLDAWLDARELLTPLSARLLPPHELLPSLSRRPRPPGPSLLSERADGAAGDVPSYSIATHGYTHTHTHTHTLVPCGCLVSVFLHSHK